MDTFYYYNELLQCKSQEDLFGTCYSYAQELFTPERARVYFFNETRDFLICRFRFGQLSYSDGDDKISADQVKSVIVRTIVENNPQIVRDIYADSRVDVRVLEKLGVNSIISIPIHFTKEAWGAISFDFKEKEKFDEEKIVALVTFIRMASLIRENALLTDQINEVDNKLKEELEKKRYELERVNEQLLLKGRLSSLGQLASGVAHEIKNPLAVIKMITTALFNETDEKNEIKNDLSVIKSEILRLEEIVNHFLNFARPKKVEVQPVNINEILLEVNDFLKIKFKSSNINVNMDLYIPFQKIDADKNQLKQVFLNILLNAYEVCKELENAYIDIKTLIISRKNGRFLKIEISDNGPGIKEDIISQIFTPFTTGRSDGLGLGLSICFRIISDHGGKITAKNRLSGGAKFEILLPIDKEKVDSAFETLSNDI